MKQNHEIRIKLSKDELETITSKAKRVHMKPTEFLKHLGLNIDLEVKVI